MCLPLALPQCYKYKVIATMIVVWGNTRVNASLLVNNFQNNIIIIIIMDYTITECNCTHKYYSVKNTISSSTLII